MAPQTVKLTEAQRALFAARRAELALTQEEIEGVSAAWIRSVENGYADSYVVSKLAELADGLAMTPADMRSCGLPEVANRLIRLLKRRDEYAQTILRSVERNPKNRLHLVACPPPNVRA